MSPISLFLAAALTVPADVLPVDSSGFTPGAFLSLQDALDASVDGDVIVIQAATEGVIHVPDRDLVITTTPSGFAQIDQLWIESLAADRDLVIRGLSVGSNAGQSDPGLVGARAITITGALGSVRLESVQARGWPGTAGEPSIPPISGGLAMVIGACDDVALKNCLLIGGDGADADDGDEISASAGGIALICEVANVAVSGSFIRGGTGGSIVSVVDLPAAAAPGGRAITFLAHDLQLETSTVIGGPGGSVFCDTLPCPEGGRGGDAFFGTTANLRGTTLLAGVGGTSLGGDGLPGVEVPVGEITTIDLPTTSLNVTSPVEAGEVGFVLSNVQGQAAPVFMLISADTDLTPFGDGSTVLLASAPFIGGLVPLGVSPINFAFLGPTFPAAGPDAVTAHLQTVAQVSEGFVLGDWSSLTVLR